MSASLKGYYGAPTFERKYPTQEFLSFVEAARSFVASRGNKCQADESNRLECLFFDGFDSHYEGDEPPVR
jgi:hypothetical protein